MQTSFATLAVAPMTSSLLPCRHPPLIIRPPLQESLTVCRYLTVCISGQLHLCTIAMQEVVVVVEVRAMLIIQLEEELMWITVKEGRVTCDYI